MSAPLIAGIVLALLVIWVLLWLPARTRTRSYTTRTVIDRRPEDVFSFIADLPRSLPILTGSAIRGRAPSHLQLGTTFTTGSVAGSISFVEKNEIVAYDPPGRFAWREEGFSRGTESIQLDADGHATAVTHTYEAVEWYWYALLGLVIFSPLLNWAGSRSRRSSWARIKREIETGASA